MKPRVRDVRKKALERIRYRLESQAWPRLEMSLVLAATAASAFTFSFALLHLGLRQMWLRYPLAVLFGYAVFLLGLKLWLALRRQSDHVVSQAAGDWLDLPLELPGGGSEPAPVEFGGGGGFGGSGAGSSWADAGGDAGADGPAPALLVAQHPAPAVHGGGGHAGGGDGGGGHGGGGFSFDLDLDEGFAIIFLALALFAAALSSLYVIYVAPSFMAELLLDSALVGGLYRRARHIERHDWVADALRRTWFPLALTTVLFLAAGTLMQHAAPEAASIGGFIAHVTR